GDGAGVPSSLGAPRSLVWFTTGAASFMAECAHSSEVLPPPRGFGQAGRGKQGPAPAGIRRRKGRGSLERNVVGLRPALDRVGQARLLGVGVLVGDLDGPLGDAASLENLGVNAGG